MVHGAEFGRTRGGEHCSDHVGECHDRRVEIRWSFGGFHSLGGTPIAGWFISWKTPNKMDDDWGYPHFGKPPFHTLKGLGPIYLGEKKTIVYGLSPLDDGGLSASSIRFFANPDEPILRDDQGS